MGRAQQDYLDAALELLDRFGPADPRLGISVTSLSAGASVSRSTIYRHWDGVDAMNADLARYAIVAADGWQRRVLAQPVDVPLVQALAAALDSTAGEPGIAARTGMSGWPQEAEVRSDIAAWERAWLDRFSAWLGAHLAAHGRVLTSGDPRQLALALASLVEGHLILDRVWSEPDDDEWFTGRAGAVPEMAAQVFDDMTVAGDDRRPPTGSPATWSAAGLDTGGLAGAKLRILERATDAYLAAAFGDAAARDPGRLVDIGRLARRLDVTERRLYEIWPTTTECNVDIVRALGDRALEAFDRVAHDIMAVGLGDAVYASYAPLSVSGLQNYVATAATPGRVHTLQCTAALVDPEVLTAFVDTTREASSSIRTIFMALLTVGWRSYLRADVPANRYLSEVRSVIAGMQRLAGLHPALLDEQGEYEGEPYPICGLACYHVMRALITDERPDPGDRPEARNVAPPLR